MNGTFVKILINLTYGILVYFLIGFFISNPELSITVPSFTYQLGGAILIVILTSINEGVVMIFSLFDKNKELESEKAMKQIVKDEVQIVRDEVKSVRDELKPIYQVLNWHTAILLKIANQLNIQIDIPPSSMLINPNLPEEEPKVE